MRAILAPLYPNTAAAKRLAEESKKPHRPIERLVQLGIYARLGYQPLFTGEVPHAACS